MYLVFYLTNGCQCYFVRVVEPARLRVLLLEAPLRFLLMDLGLLAEH